MVLVHRLAEVQYVVRCIGLLVIPHRMQLPSFGGQDRHGQERRMAPDANSWTRVEARCTAMTASCTVSSRVSCRLP